jgi:hypothetical protein
MKIKINKKNTTESITLDLEPTANVDDLLLILYAHRSNSYEHLSFSEYQKFISVYQYSLYGEYFRNKLFPGTRFADSPLKEPYDLTWEECTENQYPLHHIDATGNKILFWQANMKSSEPECDNELQSHLK